MEGDLGSWVEQEKGQNYPSLFNVSFKLTCQNISRQTQAQEEIVLSESYNTREAAFFKMAHVMISTYSPSFLVLKAQFKIIHVHNVYQKHTGRFNIAWE